MTNPNGSDTLVIRNPRELRRVLQHVAAAHRVAFDTEAASFHRYVDRVYLIQLSTDQLTTLVDPLAIDDLSPIGAILGDPETEIVFHDADYDLRVLDRDYGFRATNIFDTRIAAQLAGESAVGLSSLLEKFFDVRLDKRFQRADWSARPLTSGMMAYAADDTRYLLRLRDLLDEQLYAMGRRHWLAEECARLEHVRWAAGRANDNEGYLRLKGARALTPRSLAVLQQLHAWREQLAAELDRAPFRILSNQALVAMAKSCPTNLASLSAVDGVGPTTVRRHGMRLLEAIRAGLGVPSDRLPLVLRSRRPPPDPAYDARVEQLKEVRNGAARRIGLQPGLVCPNGTLQAIARLAPATPADLDGVSELRAWQREILGDETLIAAAQDGTDG